MLENQASLLNNGDRDYEKKSTKLGDKNHGQSKNLAETKALYDKLLQLDPNAYFQPATEEEKHKEQEFFDKSEIEEANLQHETFPIVQPKINESETRDYAFSEAGPGPRTQAHREELQPVQELPIHEEEFLDLDVETAKNMFKVDGAEYAFSTWFTEAKEIDLASIILEAENDDEAMQEVYLQCLYRNYLEEEEINEIIKLPVDAYRASDKGNKSQTKIAFKIIDKYEPIRESKKAGEKYVRSGPNVILTKKMKPGFWVRIDKKFLVREVSEQSEHGLTEIHQQKINDLEKKMCIPGAQVQNVADEKYRSDKYEEIRIVVHNGYAFPRNQHFSRNQMIEYYKGNIWEAISNALRRPQAIWLMGVENTSQTIFQFVLEDGCIFRTWKKHTEIIEACKQLVNDTIDWQYQEGIINKKKKLIFSESLKVVDLAEQIFGANYAGSRLANEINEWHPISGKVNENIRQAYKGELDFLIKDCTDAGTFARRKKYPLRFILTYYKEHQPQYTYLQVLMLAYVYINLLEMLQRFDPNKVIRIATDSIYVQKEALYKIENILAFFKQVEVKSDPNLCSHYPSCAMCTDPEEFFISKSEYAKWIKEFQKTKTPLKNKKSKKFNPVKWHDKGEKIYGPVTNIVYWPKNRHWESIKNISESTAPSIHNLITRCRKSYLNKEGGLEKTMHAIRIFKNINMVVFTYTNALAKDFEEKHNVKAQTWHSFFRWNEIPGLSEKKELVKNNIVYLSLNILSDKLLKDMLVDKKVIDWKLGYAMTIHTSQRMTLKLPQCVWIIDKNLAWNNLIYLAVGHVEYLNQLIRIEVPSLLPEIVQEIEKAKKKRQLKHKLRLSIQEKLIRYISQNKEKGCKFDLIVDYILTLKCIQEDKCTSCLIEMKFE
ncbi:17759_t:CDS:2 [Cetraspora pellucida]|uniref:17759_t:CDS:1 n=1 Tax=Cetraspora pellucida TaxID=1433469 RepID=A0A9N9NB13_9GLOM|nr:17759_t:CDS:2 [Cetraspora pellucida]